MNPWRCHPSNAFDYYIREDMHKAMVTTGTRRRSQSESTPAPNYSNSKKGYPDDDRNRCFIHYLLGSLLYIDGTDISWPCERQGSFIFSLVNGLLQWH